MRKCILVLFAFALIFPATAFSATNGFGVYGGVLLPQGDMDDLGFDTGFTGGIQWFKAAGANEALKFGGTLGFAMSSGDTSIYGADVDTDVLIIEVLPSIRYELAAGENAKIIGQAGAGFAYLDIEAEASYMGHSASESDSEIEFGFGIGGGVQFASHLELLALYKSFSDADYLTLTLGYNF